jgi:1-acyl-sn-glycerol-3-phosphate acyltransferase
VAGPPAREGIGSQVPADAPRVGLLRALWRLIRFALHGLHGLAVVLLTFPKLDRAGRESQVRWWSAKTLRMLGVGIDAQGHFDPGAKLITSNHLSWLDITLVHAVHPQARFVSKAEVRDWPLVNRLVDAGRTLYLQRERARDALRVVHQMADALRAGDTVAVFPEGTTSDGHVLLPFHANLLQAAISTGTPVQPVVLWFSDARYAASPSALFIGETTIAQSLWRLARANGLVAHLRVLALVPTPGTERRALAEQLRGLIGRELRSDGTPRNGHEGLVQLPENTRTLS